MSGRRFQGKRFTGTLEEYLRARLRMDAASGCWLWTMSTAGGSYGYFLWRGQWTYAHRAAWTVWRGELPQGLYVLHRCDNPLCLNPDHLFLGTQADNLRDMDKKGRRRNHTPEANAKRSASLRRFHNARRAGLGDAG